jgi:hypothetical protein
VDVEDILNYICVADFIEARSHDRPTQLIDRTSPSFIQPRLGFAYATRSTINKQSIDILRSNH